MVPGVSDAYDGWIEILSLEAEPADLGGWAPDDIAGGGTVPYVFPSERSFRQANTWYATGRPPVWH
jgi:hypothetical protein